MPRKTFAAAPKPKQPTAEEIEAFERSGAGNDRRPAPVAASRPAPEPTERLSLDLPAVLHRRFKTACSATNRKMTAEVKAFIERRTAELEAEAGITRK